MTTRDNLIRNASFAADQVAIGFKGTEAQKTRAIVERAFDFAFGNGLIQETPAETHPEWLVLDPPFSPGREGVRYGNRG